MARYVAVSNDGVDKTIKDGPLELNDPSEYTPEEGNVLMPEEEALAQGYHYSEGGAFAPEQSAGADTAVQDGQGGDGEQGVQGAEGGQGAQTQPGVQGAQGDQNQQ